MYFSVGCLGVKKTLIVYVQLRVTCILETPTECIVAVPLQQWLSESSKMLPYTYIASVVNLYRTAWKWLTESRDRTCTDALQATALTHINLQYPAI
jgi:hypothetical protein